MNKFTQDLPDKKGYYWWYDKYTKKREVLEVSEMGANKFYAENLEFAFEIEKLKNEFWSYIECPALPE